LIKVNDSYITADVVDIISTLKLQLETQGVKMFYKCTDTRDNYMICCPIHKDGQEHKPSMGILKSDGTCHCFACGWVGSLAQMISYCFGYADFGDYGKKWLIQNFLTLDIENRGDIPIDVDRSKVTVLKKPYVSEEELDSYRYYHPYMYKRKLTNEIIDRFDIGYDKEQQCITFPVRDKTGGTLFIARRSVNKKYFNYPSGAEKPLYGLYELSLLVKQPEELIVCESMLDALTCWVYCKPAVALNGLGNDLQFKQLREFPCRKLILATDNDEAGMKARQRIAKNVQNKIITQYILPEHRKDINELDRDEFDNLKEIFI